MEGKPFFPSSLVKSQICHFFLEMSSAGSLLAPSVLGGGEEAYLVCLYPVTGRGLPVTSQVPLQLLWLGHSFQITL